MSAVPATAASWRSGSIRRVFQALTTLEARSGWFLEPEDHQEGILLEMDIRVGGRERMAGGPPGTPVHRYEALYDDIAPGERSSDPMALESFVTCRGHALEQEGSRIDVWPVSPEPTPRARARRTDAGYRLALAVR